MTLSELCGLNSGCVLEVICLTFRMSWRVWDNFKLVLKLAVPSFASPFKRPHIFLQCIDKKPMVEASNPNPLSIRQTV